MEIWIPITIGAAATQSLRFMLQKRLTGMTLSTAGATFARFVYAAPLVAIIAAAYAFLSDQTLSALPADFVGFALLGGTTQILATLCVVAIFQYRNFAVGITLKKTEVLLSAFFGIVLFGDKFTALTIFAMCIGLVGVLLLSDPPGGAGPWRKRIWNRATALGLGAGILFGLSGNGYRGAALWLEEGDALFRALVTLACVTAYQTVAMSIWLRLKQPGQMTRVFSAWRVAGLVGLTSMIGSICWFTAFALQSAAYVNAVGQIELLFSVVIGAAIFGERISLREWQGIILLTGSIVALVLLI